MTTTTEVFQSGRGWWVLAIGLGVGNVVFFGMAVSAWNRSIAGLAVFSGLFFALQGLEVWNVRDDRRKVRSAPVRGVGVALECRHDYVGGRCVLCGALAPD